MIKPLNFLKDASDYKVISEETYNFNFNENRGGSFQRTMPQTVEAYGTTWECRLKWIDKGWGDFTFEYSPNGDVTLPEKINIERKWHSIPCWQDSTEIIYFFGKEVIEFNDNYGRKPFVSMTAFKAELETATDEKELLDIIKTIQNREYYIKVSSFLDEKGFTHEEKKKFFRCKSGWKYELIATKLRLIRCQSLPKALFLELSQCNSHWKFNEIASKWGIDEFKEMSLPRKTAYCKLIAGCKTDTGNHTNILKKFTTNRYKSIYL